jgi:DNA polymerase V
MLALCDCNSFYVSCETVFNPKSLGKPVIVLSNNDGCVVSRSPEAKAIPIPMGVPVFKIRHLIRQFDVQVYSSNYSLYGDLSGRVMATLAQFSPALEIYSIDEAFLCLDGFQHIDLEEYGQQIRQRVKQWTGIPVSVGIASTKTLTKVAGDIAKKRSSGVFLLPDPPDEILAGFPVADLWGIGRNHARTLSAYGILTALQLRDASPAWIDQRYGVTMQRLVLELKGQRCFEIEQCPPTKKSIIVSRSFGQPVSTLPELREAIATYASRAAEKLRSHGLTADAIAVFAKTSRFAEQYYKDSATVTLPHSSDDTAVLLQSALRGCDQVFRSGERFKKAGVVLLGLQPKAQQQMGFWEPQTERSERLMATMDAINARFGREAIQYGAAGLKKPWVMRSEWRSPRYTTVWSEIPVARAE